MVNQSVIDSSVDLEQLKDLRWCFMSSLPFTRDTRTVSPAFTIESGIAGICGPQDMSGS